MNTPITQKLLGFNVQIKEQTTYMLWNKLQVLLYNLDTIKSNRITFTCTTQRTAQLAFSVSSLKSFQLKGKLYTISVIYNIMVWHLKNVLLCPGFMNYK